MKSRQGSIIFVCVIVAILLIFSCTSKKIELIETPSMPKQSCTQCHESLSKTLPPNHVAIAPQEVKYCAMCHISENKLAPFEWIVHYSHYNVSEFEGDCWSCHFISEKENLGIIGYQRDTGVKLKEDEAEKLNPYFASWASSKYLDFAHAQSKVSCRSCHVDFYVEDEFQMETCLKCHGSYSDLATLTKKVEPNPHDSHLGEINCTLCHKAHETSANFCEQCHAFEFNVP